ncbi:MAG: ABC transporter ATP-binding protein [Gemmataceae bacterium]
MENVWKMYGQTRALSGLTFVVEAGEVFGLLGANGAGKTTLMSILAGLIGPDCGRLIIEGREIHPKDRSWRHLVGIGTQDLSIYPELSARENLLFFGKLYGLSGAHLDQRIESVLKAVALWDRKNQRADRFSGGMKRRLNLAVAILHEPKILLLDEPTTGVDPQSRNHIFEQVKELNRNGLTVIYTSHYMEEVQSLCNRIAILDHGQMKACSTLPKLLAMLESSATVTVDQPPLGFANRLSQLAGISRVVQTGNRFEIFANPLGAAVADVAKFCVTNSVNLTDLTASEPNLERVFLHLTGRGLRD